LALTTPPISHMGPAQIAFTPDGLALIVSIKGMNPPVLMYPFANGMPAASALNTSNNGNVNFGFAFQGSTTTFVMTDAAPYGNFSGIIVVDANTGYTPSVAFPAQTYFLITNQTAACWISYAPTVGHFYVSNSGSNVITEVSVSGSSFTVVSSYSLGNNKAPTDSVVLTLGGQDYIFFNEAKAQVIAGFAISSGSFTPLMEIASNGGATAAGLAGYLVPAPASTTASASTGQKAPAASTGSHSQSSTSTGPIIAYSQTLFLLASWVLFVCFTRTN